jgi:hypothetical protein
MLKEAINKQISKETWEKIVELENLEKENQKQLGLKIIGELSIIHFEPYLAFDEEGNILIALQLLFSGSIEECLYSGKHDVILASNEIYIEDESYIEEQFKSKEHVIRIDIQIEGKNDIREKYQDSLNDLINRRARYVDNHEKITKIDKEIEETEKIISNLNNEIAQLLQEIK